MSGVIETLIGVAIGFGLSEARTWLDRRRQAGNHWLALKAEIEFAKAKAISLREDNVSGPLYRLSHTCFDSVFPQMLAEGKMNLAEITALVTFFTEVKTLNRGLDRSAEAADDDHRLQEHSRNLLKASRLEDGGSIYEAAADAVQCRMTA